MYQIYFNLFYFFKGGRLYNQNKLWNIKLYLSDFMSVGQKTAGSNSMLRPAKPGIWRDKTMTDKLLCIPNDNTQNIPFCRLQLVANMFGH